MPTYEYECAACRHRFEALQAITARPLRKCPACGTNKARRLISAGSGLIFKGSGFYCTDYRKPSEKNARADQDKKPRQSEGGPAESQAKSSGAKPPAEIGGKPAGREGTT